MKTFYASLSPCLFSARAIVLFFIVNLFFFCNNISFCQNVGIGTDTPGQKLEVAGNIKLGNNVMVEGKPDLRVYRNLAS